MKNKLITLSGYLTRLGYIKESNFINKFAAYSEEDIKQNFGDIYNKLFPKGMSDLSEANVNKSGMIISQALKIMTKDEVLSFNSIEEISYALKTKKKEKKKDKRKSVLNKYKELDKEMKTFIIENNLSNEEVNFAYHKRSGHELFDCLRDILRLKNDYVYIKDRMKDLPIIDKVNFKFGEEEIKFQRPELYDDIDKANDAYIRIEQKVGVIESGDATSKQRAELLNYYNYIYNGINKMNIEYDAALAGKAKADSKIMYNDGNWAIVHSWSEEACQYWERPAVLVHDDGTASFKTCTSRIQNNFYSSYENYMMFQVIKLKDGRLDFYDSPNDMFTVCYDPRKEVISGSASVNANDEGITDEDLVSFLPEKIYEALGNIIKSKYFDKEIDIRKKKVVKSIDNEYVSFFKIKDMYNLGFFSGEEIVPYLLDNIDSMSSSDLFFFMSENLITKDIMDKDNKFYSEYIIKLELLNAEDFFLYYSKGLVAKSYFEEHVEFFAMDISTVSFFSYYKKGIIPEGVFLEHVEFQSDKLYSVTFFENYKKKLIPEETFLKFLSQKASELVGYGLLQYYREGLVTKELFLKNVVRASSRANDYLISILDKENIVPEEDMLKIINNRVEELSFYSFYIYALNGRITEENIRLHAVDKLKNISSPRSAEIYKKGFLPSDLFYEILKNKDNITYYEISTMIKEVNLDPEIAKKLFILNAKKEDANVFYYNLGSFKEIIKPSDFPEDLLKDKAKSLEKFDLDIHYEKNIISEDIYNSVLKYFIKDIGYYEMLKFVKKGVIPKDFLIYIPYEKLKYSVGIYGCNIIIGNLDYIKSLNNGILAENYQKIIEEECKDYKDQIDIL